MKRNRDKYFASVAGKKKRWCFAAADLIQMLPSGPVLLNPGALLQDIFVLRPNAVYEAS